MIYGLCIRTAAIPNQPDNTQLIAYRTTAQQSESHYPNINFKLPQSNFTFASQNFNFARMNLKVFITSSIGRKLLMSFTGLFLCLFLVTHLMGNLQLFYNDNGYAFNNYAVFMTTNPLIKTVSYILYFTIPLHAIWGIYVERKNRQARPHGYAVHAGNATSSFFSRNMAILGVLVLVFICVHLSGFWYQYKFGSLAYVAYTENIQTGEITSAEHAAIADKKLELMKDDNTKVTVLRDLYREVATAYKNIFLVLFYVLSMAAVSFHLIHGFQSGFQTLGINHKKYTPVIKAVSLWGFGIIIPVLFALMPLYFYFKK